MIRVKFWLIDYDIDLWAFLPARVNKGDDVYLDEFLTLDEKKRIEASRNHPLRVENAFSDIEDGIIFTCVCTGWQKDNAGAYLRADLGKEE